METLTDIEESARKIHAAILRALADTSQKRVADALGVHESTISRMKQAGGEFEETARMLALLGLKVVAAGDLTYKPEMIEALHTLAKAGLDLSPDFAVLKSDK